MNTNKNLILIVLFVFTTVFVNTVTAQLCLQPAWADCKPNCLTGDTVSYDNIDWRVKDGGSSWQTPSEVFPATITFERIPGSCRIASAPAVDATTVRANYCTTSFGIGKISSNGGATVIRRGFVYGESSLPTVENDLVLVDASTSVGDEFEGLMENLTPETDYYVRTFAENSEGITYGTQASFTTRAASECATDCDLACDITNPNLLNPPEIGYWNTPRIIGINDTVCITQNVSIVTNIILRGMIKICNKAQLNLTGTIDVENRSSNASLRGQIVYEGCDERFSNAGGYTGEYYIPIGANDPTQMISYCADCNENDQTQFFKGADVPAFWAATCRPTSTLIVPLPVELISFSANIREEGVLLEWSTGAEINNSHFEIELSYDGVNWFKIGLVEGSGNSTQNIDYKFLDNSASEGLQYYRLKQVDFDNSFQYSTVKHVSFDKENDKPTSFIAFQNQNNQVEVQAKFNGMGEAYLIDTRGRIVETLTFVSTNKNGTKLTFQNTSLANGVYFVKIKSGNALLGQKVQILK